MQKIKCWLGFHAYVPYFYFIYAPKLCVYCKKGELNDSK